MWKITLQHMARVSDSVVCIQFLAVAIHDCLKGNRVRCGDPVGKSFSQIQAWPHVHSARPWHAHVLYWLKLPIKQAKVLAAAELGSYCTTERYLSMVYRETNDKCINHTTTRAQ